MGQALQCLKCKDIIVSHFTHDLNWCKCGSVAIDGGREYTRVLGDLDDWRLLSEVEVGLAEAEDGYDEDDEDAY